MVFANFVSQRQQVDFGDKIFTPKFTASDMTTKNTGALFTTKEERDFILNLPSTGTSGTNDCPVNFNAVNALYQTNTGIVDNYKVISINGSNITFQAGNQTFTQPLFQMNSEADFNQTVVGVYVNASSGLITIVLGGNSFVLSTCGAIILD